MSEIRWLHFSDIHVGVENQEALWSRFNTVFLEDLKKMLERVGRIDFIVFSGDLAQKGEETEFDA